MPKVIIDEIDNTSSGATLDEDNVVVVFGYGTNGEDDFMLAYHTDVDAFITAVGPLADQTPKRGYNIAKLLLSRGIKVLYGYWPSNINEDDNALKAGLDLIADRGSYGDVRFITLGDFETATVTDTSSIKAAQYAIKIAATRGDAIALVDSKAHITQSVTSIDAATGSIFGNDSPTITHGTTTEYISKYGAAFAGDVTIDGSEYPGYVAYLLAFKQHTANYPDWFAMAGSVRGQVNGLTEADPQFSDAAIDTLQKREVGQNETRHRATNVITEIKPYGNIIWGNRTLYPVRNSTAGEGEQDLVASSFLNIRNLCCDIKKLCYKVCRKYTFDPNSDVLWINFKSEIVELLEKMKSGQGISGYKITKLATNKKATLKAKITIVPIEAVEDFELTVELADNVAVTE